MFIANITKAINNRLLEFNLTIKATQLENLSNYNTCVIK